MDKTTLIVSRHGLYLPTSVGLKKLSSLDDLTTRIKSKSVDVLIGPNLSYLENLNLPANKSNRDQEIQKYLQAALTDETVVDSWTAETISKTKTDHLLRVFAIETDFFQEFSSVLLEKGIKVKNYASLALATTNLISDTKPHLIIFVQSDIYFLVAKLDEKIFTKPVEKLSDLKSEIAEFIISLEKQNQTNIQALYSYSDRDLSALELSINDIPINFNKLKPSFSIPSQIVNKPTKKSFKTFFVLTGLVILVATVIGLAWFFKRQATTNNSVSPTPSPSSIVVAPSPTPVDPATINVKILNGTNTRGYANEIADTLKKAGYTQIETGNDPEKKYTKNTLVINEPAISENFVKLLSELNLEVVSEEVINSQASKSATLYLAVPKKIQ